MNDAGDVEVFGWHGAHRWTWPPEIRAPRKGRYEHGPGIYITNLWSRAAQYAKGGGSVLRMRLRLKPLDEVRVEHEEVIAFVRGCRGLRHKEAIVGDIRRNQEFGRYFRPEFLRNLCVNHEALTASSAPLITEWLNQQGLPYSVNFIGQKGEVKEEWIVVHDPSLIIEASPVRAKELDSLGDYEVRNFIPFSEQIGREGKNIPSFFA